MRPEWGRRSWGRTRRAFQEEGTQGPSQGRSWGSGRVSAQPGLRGCGGDLRPHSESNAKLLRGFKLSCGGDEICISKRSLSLPGGEWIRRD